MGINRLKVILMGLLILLSSGISIGITNINYVPVSGFDERCLKLSSSGNILVDKVYNFTKDNPIVKFANIIFFEKTFYYNIYVCVVTPHTCDMNITIYDPEEDPYEITYEKNMTQDDSRIITFGSALTGNYSIQFNAIILQNLDIHIKIEKWIKCLYDVIPPEEQQKIKYYDTQKFKTGNTIYFNTTFKSDWNYKFYFQRVSPISVKLKPTVVIDHDILSSNYISYTIYRNESISLQVKTYRFGTAVEGLYVMNITIQCVVPCANIAFAVVERYQIADGVNPNDPEDPEIGPVNNTQGGILVSIPPEFVIGILVFFGFVVGTPILIIIIRRRKNSI